MNLINRLVQQAQESPTQLRPRSSMSVYENSPLLEQTMYSENMGTPVNSSGSSGHERKLNQSKNFFTAAEEVAGNEYAWVDEKSSRNDFTAAALHPASSVEDPVKQQTSNLLADEETEVNHVVPLVVPQQKKSTHLVKDTAQTQTRSENNKAIRQNHNKITASPNEETPFIGESINTVANINLRQTNISQNVRKIREPPPDFQPLMPKKKPDNPVSDLTFVADKAPQPADIATTPVEVHVSIGRIEVKARQEAPQPVKKAKAKAPMSLAAYLAEREGGKR